MLEFSSPSAELLTARPLHEPSEAFQMFASELTRQAVRPPGEDRAIGAMCLAALQELQLGGPLCNAAEDLLTVRAQESPSNQVGDFRAVVQTEVLSDHPEFPANDAYEQPEIWREPLQALGERYAATSFDTTDEELRSERLTYNLLFRKVQTDVATRALPVEYIMQSRAERFQDGVRWLNIGCGIMEGQSYLLNKSIHDLPPLTVVNTPDDRAATRKLKALLERPSLISESIGIDIADAFDANTYTWSRGSLRPSELKNKSFIQRFDALAPCRGALDDSRLQPAFFRGDILSDSDMAEFTAVHGDKKFQLVSALTMLHQLTDGDNTNKERQKLLERGRELLTDDGILLISDFAWLAPKARAPRQLNFYRHWHEPFRYRSFIWDASEPEAGLQEILRSKNSRCDIFQIIDKVFDKLAI